MTPALTRERGFSRRPKGDSCAASWPPVILGVLKRLLRIRSQDLLKTFWAWREMQQPDCTENFLRYTPACIRRGQLGNGEHAIPSNPVVYMAHGHR